MTSLATTEALQELRDDLFSEVRRLKDEVADLREEISRLRAEALNARDDVRREINSVWDALHLKTDNPYLLD